MKPSIAEQIAVPRLDGKTLEDHCKKRLEREELAGTATMSRYGVQANMIDGKWTPVQSLPDFEGVLPGGRQFLFDAKVCSQASFPLDEDKFKRRQFRHLCTRARFGAIAFLLLHFNERQLVRAITPASTWAFPVQIDHPLWAAFDRAEVKRITLADCEEYAVAVEWNAMPGGRTLRPDIVAAVKCLLMPHGLSRLSSTAL
jgi:penicillin-binding protein-related factor A (putative recombinase)